MLQVDHSKTHAKIIADRDYQPGEEIFLAVNKEHFLFRNPLSVIQNYQPEFTSPSSLFSEFYENVPLYTQIPLDMVDMHLTRIGSLDLQKQYRGLAPPLLSTVATVRCSSGMLLYHGFLTYPVPDDCITIYAEPKLQSFVKQYTHMLLHEEEVEQFNKMKKSNPQKDSLSSQKSQVPQYDPDAYDNKDVLFAIVVAADETPVKLIYLHRYV